MANSIALASKFQPILDEIYKNASLTASMDAQTKPVDFGGAAAVNVFKTSVVGMGTYSRATGYPGRGRDWYLGNPDFGCFSWSCLQY